MGAGAASLRDVDFRSRDFAAALPVDDFDQVDAVVDAVAETVNVRSSAHEATV